jgi:predicted PhzF superfamily epimerase YddE/YHI9
MGKEEVKKCRLFQVDAFASSPFTGNPAGVCLLPSAADETWMRLLAREVNVSETAFLYEEKKMYRLRWFTPVSEVALCGHATLASAHILWQQGDLAAHEVARFLTQSGELTARKSGEWIEMDFPSTPVSPSAINVNWGAVIGTQPLFVGVSCHDLFVEVESEEVLRDLSPDVRAVRNLPYRGLVVTARSSSFDFVSRFFAPAIGLAEDPVTGSTHCALAPYWSKKLGKTELKAFQESARGGELLVRQQADRIVISGKAVTVFGIELRA